MKNVVVIIQARMGSSRLPGKSLKKIGKESVVEKLVKRLSLSKEINKIVFAVPDCAIDNPLAELLEKKGVSVFRGSENDVLDRYYKAGEKFKADIVIRVTGDCPLIEPFILDEIVRVYKNNKYDYVSNTCIRSYPRGFDCEVFSFKILKKIWEIAKHPDEREHVTPHIYLNRDKFKVFDKVAEDKFYRPNYRICIDTKEDFEVVSGIFEHFGDRIDMTAEEIIEFLDNNPQVCAINQHIEQKKLNIKN